RKGYNPQHKGKKSFQPILTFLAETREYVGGELRKGDRPTGKQIAQHLANVFAALPPSVERIYARADSGFYCWQAVEAYEKRKCGFVGTILNTLTSISYLFSGRTITYRYETAGRVNSATGAVNGGTAIPYAAVPS